MSEVAAPASSAPPGGNPGASTPGNPAAPGNPAPGAELPGSQPNPGDNTNPGEPEVKLDPLNLDDPDADKDKPFDPKDHGLEDKPIVFEPTGDPALDLCMDFLGARGIGENHPALKAAETGDFAPIKALLNAMGDKAKGWERFIALGEKAYEASKAVQEKADAEITAKIADSVGGAENWNKIREWAGKNAEPHERAQVNAAFKAGGVAAIAMAMYLGHLMSKDPNVTQQGRSAVQPGAGGSAAPAAVLSASEYAAEVHKLATRMGGQHEGTQAYRDLQARRVAGQRRGI
jgi:hypothetical protein